MKLRNPIVSLSLAALCAGGSLTAQDWQLVKPSTTGVPGEEVRMVRFAPDGLIWVGARWPFWGEGGFGLYDRGTDSWSVLSNADGTFPSAFPNDIAWAADGSVWIGTGSGLVHRVGNTQTVYTAANSPLKHNAVGSVAVAPDGHVWLNNSSSSAPDAIFEFDGTSWTEYTVGNQLPWDPPWTELSDVIVDGIGHVWVANTVLNGVAEYDGVTWTLHGAGVGRFGEIAEDTAGNIWLRAGVGGGNSFWRFDRASFRQYPISTTPTSIGIDDDGAVFLGDWGGTIRRSTDFGESFQTWASGLNQVFDISPDPAGPDVWIGTIGAVGHFDGNGFLQRDFNSYNTGIGDYFVDYFDLDRDGNFWVATGEAGLSRFDGLAWRNWGNHNVGSEPYPFAGNEPMGGFYLDRNGDGWMGGNGIARWIPDTGQFNGFWNWQTNPGMGVTLFVDFAEDAQGRLFAADENGGVMRFNGSMWVNEPLQSRTFNEMGGLIADSTGTVWLASGFDVWRHNGTEWVKLRQPRPTYFFDLGGISSFAIGPDDTLWFGTVKGLVRFDGSEFTLFDKSNSPLPAAHVAGIDVRADAQRAVAIEPTADKAVEPALGGLVFRRLLPGENAHVAQLAIRLEHRHVGGHLGAHGIRVDHRIPDDLLTAVTGIDRVQARVEAAAGALGQYALLVGVQKQRAPFDAVGAGKRHRLQGFLLFHEYAGVTLLVGKRARRSHHEQRRAQGAAQRTYQLSSCSRYQ